jgi:PKD repeat protein
MSGVFLGENSSTKDTRISDFTGKIGSFIPFLPGKEVSGNESVNFTVNNTSNPFEFQFADHTLNATVWEWGVDGDGITDSRNSSFNYTYNETGKYNISFNVIVDNNISLSGTLMINVP